MLNTELTGYKEKDGYVQYELDGKWYNMATEDTDVTTGDKVKAYVFNGVVLDLDTDDGDGSFPSDVAVVVGTGNTSLDGDQAKVRFFDGTSKTVTVSDDTKVTLTEGTAYKVSGSDSDMKFENLKESTKYNGYQYDGTGKKADPDNDKIGTDKVSDSAVVILYTAKGTSKQISGKQFNALKTVQVGGASNTAVSASFSKEQSGLNRVMMAAVKVADTNLVGESSDNYAYIVTGGVRTTNSNVKYTIWTGSENVTVTEDTSYSKNARKQGTLIGYSDIDKDNFINDVKVYGTIDDAADAITTLAGGDLQTSTLYRGGNESNVAKYVAIDGNQLNVTADTTVILVDSKADDDKIGLNYSYGDKLPQGSKYKDAGEDKYLVNAFWLMDAEGSDDTDIDVLVIDSTGAFDGFELDDVKAAATTATADSGNKASTEYATAATLKFDLEAKNYEASDSKDVKVKATVKDANDDAYNTGITGDLTSDVTLDMSGDGADTADDQTVIFGNNVAVGKYKIEIVATYDGKATTIKTVPFEVTKKKIASSGDFTHTAGHA